ncbi:hypothetical protein [Paenibacillus contaminans]|uniref:Uncharacterized protein n=1 Tax=Paenibacillus contaminans TaxID=450362 RepID=A0A329MSE2_9BACL|nr:hypothetical protein [Paenibacillus contaminans]RAV20877.1 hypothetical protein DQG23_12350 [Paenibacillus contaminans]
MLTIAAVFAGLGFFEWRYLQKNNRKGRTMRLVMGTAIFLFLCLEILYAAREHWTIVTLIETIFGPLQHAVSANRG